MDALDVHETNQFDHKSTIPGKMHACGHDGHTVMLLGAAKYLAETKNFDGTVYFIFQPAEENEGGGRVMVEEGLFEKFPVEGVYGMHNIPGIPVGKFAVRPGPMMAAYDIFEVVREGRRRARRHAASRHRSGGRRRAHRDGAAVDRGAQRRSDGHRRRVDDADPCRRHLERDPAGMHAARHGAHLQEAGAGHDREAASRRSRATSRRASAPRSSSGATSGAIRRP